MQWYILVYTFLVIRCKQVLLKRLCEKLKYDRIDYALVGGYAVALHGAVRGTVDIDFVIKWNKNNLMKSVSALNELGLVSRLPITADEVFSFRDEYINNRNLIAWNFYNPDNPAEQVDIIIDFDLSGKSVVSMKVADVEINVISIKQLIKMKKKSARPQDLADIDALEKIANKEV